MSADQSGRTTSSVPPDLFDRLLHALIVLEANGDITIAASSSREDHDQRCWIATRLLVGMGLE